MKVTLLKIGKRILRLQTTIILMVCLVVGLVLLAVYGMMSDEVTQLTQQGLEEKAITIARTVSITPLVATALTDTSSQTKPDIQAYAEHIRKLNKVEFVVVMNMQGIRLSHPNPQEIGRHFRGGDEVEALHGTESISIAEGSLGSSVRAFVPIKDEQGTQIGAVAVGLSLGSVQMAISKNKWILYLGSLLGACLGIGGAILIARQFKKLMFGMEPGEIAKLLEERSAMLQSAKEGIIAVDNQYQITLINAEARRLLGDADIVQQESLLLGDFRSLLRMDKVLEYGEPILDLEVERSGVTLLVNVVPVQVGRHIEGAIATFRDKTEISLLMERLSGISLYADALRAQTHEFMNKLHIIQGLTHMKQYDRLADYLHTAIPTLHVETDSIVKQVKDPTMAGFLLGKLSRAREVGVKLTILDQGILPEAQDAEVARELVTIVGNLLDNAIESLEQQEDKQITVGFQYQQEQLTITIMDNGKGIDKDIIAHMYEQGFSSKGKDRGIGLYLVQRSLERLNGSIVCKSNAVQGTQFTVNLFYTVKSDNE